MGLAVSLFSGYVRLAVSFFIRRCLGVSIFCKTKGLEVPIRLFVCFKIDVFSSLDVELISLKQLSISEKTSIPTSPKLSEFHRKLENIPERHLVPEKKVILLGYNNEVL